MFVSCYDLVRGMFHVKQEIWMATQNVVKVSPAEKQEVCDALEMYAKSLERAERAAKGPAIAAAYRDAAGRVRGMIAKFMSGELEL